MSNSVISENELSDEEIKNEDMSMNENSNHPIQPQCFERGNGNLHFLPLKISHTGFCKVDSFFDPLIEPKNKNNDNSTNNFSSSFRGRMLKGKLKNLTNQTNETDKINLVHTKLYKCRGGNFKIGKINKIDNFFIWKFDEEIPYNHALLNIERTYRNLEVLK